MGMHPWILQELVASRQADIERRVRRRVPPPRATARAVLRRVGGAVIEIRRKTTKRSAGAAAPADPRLVIDATGRKAA
jgi:hypothetical protein